MHSPHFSPFVSNPECRAWMWEDYLSISGVQRIPSHTHMDDLSQRLIPPCNCSLQEGSTEVGANLLIENGIKMEPIKSDSRSSCDLLLPVFGLWLHVGSCTGVSFHLWKMCVSVLRPSLTNTSLSTNLNFVMAAESLSVGLGGGQEMSPSLHHSQADR